MLTIFSIDIFTFLLHELTLTRLGHNGQALIMIVVIHLKWAFLQQPAGSQVVVETCVDIRDTFHCME